jgi:hypothetical protein
VIEKKTLLILGAGASAHLDFPCGPQLREKIVKTLQNRIPQPLDKMFEEAHLRDFCLAFLQSGVYSIDQFLEHRQEYLDVGKAAIAYVLIRCEIEAQLHDFAREHWYQYLVNAMRAPSFEETRENKLAVITFNYDRSLEHYLYLAWHNQWGKSADDVAELIGSFPIIHAHGKLGDLPWMRKVPNRSYDRLPNEDAIRLATKGMAIVHEEQTPAMKQEIVNAVEWAERIFFLGLSYDQYNMAKLGFPYKQSGSPARIAGTCFGLTPAEAADVEHNYEVDLNEGSTANLTCLNWLRNWGRLN